MSHSTHELHALLDAMLDGTITGEQHERLARELGDSADSRRLYLRYIDLHLNLRTLHGETREPVFKIHDERSRKTGRPWLALAAAVALGLTVGVVMLVVRRESVPPAPATLVQQAGAKFFGPEPALTTGSPLAAERDYVLTSGMVQLAFGSGAEAIIEAPAVFRIGGPMRMTMRVGRCSVHAEGPAEGFVVETPHTRVIDRGTRFSVEVDEGGGAVVQVAEGAADVLPGRSAPAALSVTQLRGGMAQRYFLNPGLINGEVAFDPARFIRRLPDRVVGYSVTTGPGGGAEELVGVTLQRGGVSRTYRAEELIGVKLTHFKGARSRAHMSAGRSGGDPFLSGGARASLLEADHNVTTGLINPGGSEEPLASDPVMNETEDPRLPNTPGFAVRFARPVVNGAGPDVVFFELQVVTNPDGGDAFHVGPLGFRPGLRSHTVLRYDIDLLSPGAAMLESFRLFTFHEPVGSLPALQTTSHNGGPEHTLPTKLLAVGIDLSDLGYDEGVPVEGLFFQDALDDDNFVDPVLIGGLPTTGENKD